IPTVTDIISELEKPGRDPRGEFKTASFQEGVEEISDLKADMILEGVVTNVTNFGAFVDVGVHQDGLVHISAMSEKFIKDPREVVKAGDLVKVKVMEVDLERRRIGLTMRLADRSDERQQPARGSRQAPSREKKQAKKRNDQNQKPGGTMASAFANALKR
ncbi:MAG: S1 RNA-binding domain-containing protein, partial [Candidatus Sedimenticola sp. 6PFRAG5]